MASTLILMRHGKAKQLAEGQIDFDRPLSEAGKRSLIAKLGEQLLPLDTSKSIQVWSSPALRTTQTASLLCVALKKLGVKPKGGVHETDSLWSQNADVFLEEVRACEADTVIAVGHNPFLETICEQLTGAHIPMATGALTAIGLGQNPANPASHVGKLPENRLLWFSQGPVSQLWKTLVSIERVLSHTGASVKTRREAFLADPDDIETMHKFRVSIRTLRSLTAFIAPWQDAKQNKTIGDNLKQLVGETSRLRELDVLTEQAVDAQSTSDELVVFCANEASNEREKVIRFLQSKGAEKKLDIVLKELADIRWKPKYVKSGLPASDVRARFDLIASQLEEDISTLDLSMVEKTHDVRKDAKRVRYVAENFKGFIGEDAVSIAKGMTAHQDNLGAVCDARVNIDIINGFEGRDVPEAVAWDLALLRAQNETFLYTTLREAR